MQESTNTDLTIYYDGDCLFCTSYVSHLRIKQSVGSVALISLRENHTAREYLQDKGYILDNGMVVYYGGHYYAGADAVNIMALLGSPSGLFNRLNRFIFSSRRMALLIYPLLRAGRNAWLFITDVAPIEPLKPTQITDQYHLFAFAYGLFAVYHYICNTTIYLLHTGVVGGLIFVLGTGLLLRPNSKRLFVFLTLSLLVDGWINAPLASNHSMIANFLVLSITLAGIWHWLGNIRSWERFFQSFAPVGRCLLITMYFFGIFHKINTDFLTPATSCATALLQKIPLFQLATNPALEYTAIYGTFVVEGAVILCLLVRRWHYYGVTLGVLFHIILACSTYQFYPTFSTLSLLLHTLFIPQQTLANFRTTKAWQWLVVPQKRALLYSTAMLLIVGQLWVNSTYIGQPVAPAMLLPWCVFAGALLIFIIMNAHAHDHPSHTTRLISPLWFLNILPVLFLLNCFSPYLGLKTRQSVNMFANLQLEAGRSNHLIIRHSPTFFPYLQDVVTLTRVSPTSRMAAYQQAGLGVVYYELLNLLEKEPDTKVSFIRHGVLYENQNYESLKPDAEHTLHPRWVRKWLQFNPVALTQPKPCSPSN